MRLAEARGALDLTLDHFLARYLAAAPRDEHDLDALDRAARLGEPADEHVRERVRRIGREQQHRPFLLGQRDGRLGQRVRELGDAGLQLGQLLVGGLKQRQPGSSLA